MGGGVVMCVLVAVVQQTDDIRARQRQSCNYSMAHLIRRPGGACGAHRDAGGLSFPPPPSNLQRNMEVVLRTLNVLYLNAVKPKRIVYR